MKPPPWSVAVEHLQVPQQAFLQPHRMGSPRDFDKQINERSSKSSWFLDATVKLEK